MKRKIMLAVFAFAILSVIACIAFFTNQNDKVTGEKYCDSERDCACGVNVRTGECFYGNEAFVDASRQCPDFCTGIAGHLEIKCIQNECTQMRIA